jgi:hypothetical protein
MNQNTSRSLGLVPILPGWLGTEDMHFLAKSSNRFAIRLTRRINKAEEKDSVLNATSEKTAVALGLGDP